MRQLVRVDRLVLQKPQDLQSRQTVGWHLAVFHEHRPAEVVALHEREALIARLQVLLLRFHLLRKKRHPGSPQPVQQLPPLLLA